MFWHIFILVAWVLCLIAFGSRLIALGISLVTTQCSNNAFMIFLKLVSLFWYHYITRISVSIQLLWNAAHFVPAILLHTFLFWGWIPHYLVCWLLSFLWNALLPTWPVLPHMSGLSQLMLAGGNHQLLAEMATMPLPNPSLFVANGVPGPLP